jgi:hypothetical protein
MTKLGEQEIRQHWVYGVVTSEARLTLSIDSYLEKTVGPQFDASWTRRTGMNPGDPAFGVGTPACYTSLVGVVVGIA